MQTECPHCHSIFRISNEQLEQADGQVRCGHCLAVFSADNPYTRFDDEVSMQARRDDVVELDDVLHISSDDEAEALPDVIPPELRAESRDKRRDYSLLGSLFWTFAILLMIVVGLLQYAYYDRLRLVQYPELRPWLGLMCQYAKCDLPDPRDPQRIELSSKNVFTHPNSDNALMVTATIVNQAEFEQDFPLLELRFENIRGETIAGRRFKPNEYLGLPTNKIGKMQPGNPVSFNLEIIDPGKDVMSYEFRFL